MNYIYNPLKNIEDETKNLEEVLGKNYSIEYYGIIRQTSGNCFYIENISVGNKPYAYG